ncbi:hypothetical protein V1525DRAFT_390621 [Lipomyces kononenkoae]|uniref:Uncharacterized protein n=1 Tax=Lipomyces kononenkoae TaxID=34357 RepID=A0ACC3SUD4_LIPKO
MSGHTYTHTFRLAPANTSATTASTPSAPANSSATSSSTSSVRYAASSHPETPARRTRVYYTEEHKAAIIRLCSQYRDRYRRGNRVKFYEDIANMFNQQYARDDGAAFGPQEREKSGVASVDAQLKEAIDRFMPRYVAVKAQATMDRQQLDSSPTDRDLATRARNGMVHSSPAAEEDEEEEAEEDEEEEAEEEEETSDEEDVTSDEEDMRGRKRARPDLEVAGLGSATSAMVSAIERMTAAISGPDNDRVAKLEERVAFFAQLEKQVETLTSTLDLVQSKLNISLQTPGRR